MTNLRRYLTAAILAAGIMSAVNGIAAAEPASIDDGSGPREVGAKIDDGSGTPGPSYDTPVSIPSVGEKPEKPGEDATPAEIRAYEKALAAHEAQVQARDRAVGLERARQEAKRYRECIARGNDAEIC
ncbi:hypothetical protein AXK57_16410 [Tsukamurella pulmonis]|uniref:hypothetical protein n=1 Tax=Tsukamurella pulmonis TaxID=47312 RepID=UPI0007969DAC|nr:hypothetical protein [Tsukamurella pulmonis]KXP08065.1 hypothetical protein AXK57_16410 [Tsukamurella pulmonis]